MTTATSSDERAVTLAREGLFRFLAAALSDPISSRYQQVLDPVNQKFAVDAADLLRDELSQAVLALGEGELPIQHLDVRPLLGHFRMAPAEQQAEHQRVFGLIPALKCPPYETEYHANSDAFFRAQQMADVAGFYQAFGLQIGAAAPERPDHLTLELEFVAFLHLKARQADGPEEARVCTEALRSFYADHVAWWVPAFTRALRRHAGNGFYHTLARIVAALMAAERRFLGITAPTLPLLPMVSVRPEEPTECGSCELDSGEQSPCARSLHPHRFSRAAVSRPDRSAAPAPL